MRRTLARRLVLPLLATILSAGPAAASGFGLFQHGGRAAGQVGAFTARAPEPSALTYNPAAIAQLPGFQLQAGLDFGNAVDKYRSASGEFEAGHIIQFPPALYATWHPGESRWALGIGIDAPYWNTLDWEPSLFPGRFLERRIDFTIAEVHPVVAVELSDRFSLGGGLRYLYGTLDQGDNAFVVVPGVPHPTVVVEVQRDTSADVDALAWDLALHYRAPAWGWGLVVRSEADLEGTGDADFRPRDVPPELAPAVATLPTSGRAEQDFLLPAEARTGFWIAPYPELRLELDLAYQQWSSFDASHVTFLGPNPFTQQVVRARDWDDTLSVRFGLEGDITDSFALFGGIAWEPSPVPDETLDPGFPRGDALVYGAGFSYSFPKISFDVGYSLHSHDRRDARGQEPLTPNVAGSYSARDAQWGFAVRWRL